MWWEWASTTLSATATYLVIVEVKGTPLDGIEEFLKPQLQDVPIVGRTVRDKGLEAGQKVLGLGIAEFHVSGAPALQNRKNKLGLGCKATKCNATRTGDLGVLPTYKTSSRCWLNSPRVYAATSTSKST